MKSWKIGIGTGLIILGLYFLFNQKEIWGILTGIISISIGITLVVSN